MPMNHRLLRPKALGVPVFSGQGYTRLWAVTNKSGAVTGSASTDSGKYAVKWWDGTTDVYDSGDPFTKSGSGTRAFEIFPCDAGGAPSGQFDGFDVSDNSLVQLRAEDVALNSSEQGDLSENELSAVALDQFYTDLDSGTGDLIVTGNPGIVDDDPTIATGKGYTVFGSVPPSTTLLLHFDGSNGATSTTDDSPENHPITFNGDAEISTTQSKFGGSSLLLNGASHVSAAYDASLDLNSGDFTVEAWYRPASTGGFQSVVSVWDGGSGNASYILGVDGGTPTVYWGTDVNTPTVSGGTVNAGQWHHLALTRSGATMRLFCDGILEDSATVTDAASGSVGLTIGKYNIANGGAGAADGYIDDVRIIKGAAVYTANFTPPTAELGVWYP